MKLVGLPQFQQKLMLKVQVPNFPLGVYILYTHMYFIYMLLTYRPGFRGIDAVTTATEQYFASRGLLFTYRGGRRFDPTHLHVKEWVDAIRNGGTTSCNVDRAFEEAITCHMATESYLRGRKVTWDPVTKTIV